MDEEAKQHGDEIPAKLGKLSSNILHLQKLTSDKEADTNWSKMDDPSGDLHHDDADTFKEAEEWLPLLPTHGYGHPSHYGEDDQPQDVGAIGPGRGEHPCVLIIRVYSSSCSTVYGLECSNVSC